MTLAADNDGCYEIPSAMNRLLCSISSVLLFELLNGVANTCCNVSFG